MSAVSAPSDNPRIKTTDVGVGGTYGDAFGARLGDCVKNVARKGEHARDIARARRAPARRRAAHDAVGCALVAPGLMQEPDGVPTVDGPSCARACLRTFDGGATLSVPWAASSGYTAAADYPAPCGELSILHVDDDIVVVNKPAFLPTENTRHIKDSVVARVTSALAAQGGRRRARGADCVPLSASRREPAAASTTVARYVAYLADDAAGAGRSSVD